MSRLAVVGQDPRFGGGARAHLQAFLDAAAELGLDPGLVYVPHPSLRPELAYRSVDRIETLRLLRGARKLRPAIQRADRVWVAAPLATHGYPALRSGRPYSCWIGTSLAEENRGRLLGLSPSRRVALRLNAPALSRIERRVLRGATRVYATSPASRTAAAHAGGLDEAGVGILPLPVDVNRFTPEPEDAWLRTLERPVLSVVGRADDSRKNIALALAMLPIVRGKLHGATLRVIGRPPRGPVPEGAEVLGEVESVADSLRGSTLLVLPSLQEGFGIAAAEALAAGVPVVSTPSGGPEDLLTRSGGGIVVPDWSPETLAGAVLRLLDDTATLTAMRRAGREHVVREHSPERLRELLAAALAETG